jgi:Integrase zinc binding domain
VDGSILSRGDGRNEIPGTPVAKTLSPPAKPVIRILTSSPVSCQRTATVGLALVTVPDEISVIPTGLNAGAAAITVDELREAPASDPGCQRFLSQTARADFFDLNYDGILIRIAPSDWSRQIVVPKVLISRVLSLEHYPPSVGHPGAHKMFRTIRRSFFWPHTV